jgi:hypothetical protein
MLAYQELKGSHGREVWFRAPRYEARKLFPHCPPRVCVGTTPCKLQNISLGGLAVVCNHTAENLPEIGDIVPISIEQSGHAIFQANARVARRENTVFGSKLAFSLINSYIELDKLLSRNVQARIAAQSPFADNNTTRLVPQEYRAFCADLLKVLGSYRDLLREHEVLAKSFDRNIDPEGAYDACEARLLQSWRAIWRTGNDLARSLAHDRDVLNAAKSFTEIVITPEMRQGAIWDRSYAKPLGYPGDFEVMNQVYQWQKTGANVYQKLVHRVGLDVAECIKTRMEMVLQTIEAVVAEKGLHTAKILNLGSGPAREVELFLSKTALAGRRVEFTLIDQEQAALTYALENTWPHIVRSAGHATVQGLNLSFTDVLRTGVSIGNLPPQDLIYSVGLIDYLVDRRAAATVQRLYTLLAPGGLMVIGNMNETPLSNIWPMEFISDWPLYYRSEAEMLAWAEGLDCESAWTQTDPTGRVRLLYVKKR